MKELHAYIAGGVRVHNDSLGDLLQAEGEYLNRYGVAFDPNDLVAARLRLPGEQFAEARPARGGQ